MEWRRHALVHDDVAITVDVAAVVQLGLRENRHPFALLVLINGLVGAMLGLERSVFPQFARESFGLESTAAALSFIAASAVQAQEPLLPMQPLLLAQNARLRRFTGRKKTRG